MTTHSDSGARVTIRLAEIGDALRIALLCDQLGYPSSSEEVQRRLERIWQKDDHVVYVAELPDKYVVGWIEVVVRPLVVTETQAEIEGLVVDEGYRQYGIGRQLMAQAEQWACEKGCWAVYLRSNVIREGAHVFYERVGYSATKTQVAFRKVVGR